MPDLRLASPFQDEEGGGLGGTTTAPEPTVTAPPTPAKFNWDEAMAAQKKAPPEAKFMAAEDFDLAAARMERQKRAEEASKVEVERGLPGEIGASLVRGALGMAKLVPQAAKFVAGDVLGSKTAKAVGEDVIGKMEEWAQSPELKPSTSAGPPIDLDRIISEPGEVIKQIGSQVSNPHFWAAQLPEGAVSMVPFFIGTYAPRAIAMAGKLGKSLEAAQAGLEVAKAAGDGAKIADYTMKIADASKKLERIGTIGGYGAAFAMEAGQGEDNVRQYEQQHPDKPIPWANKILAVIGTGVIAGSLEAASLGRIFMGKYAGDEAIARLTGAALEKGAGAIGKVAAGEMGEKVAADTIIKDIFSGRNGGNYLARKIIDSVMVEGLTEGAQSIVENAAARLGYDVDQKFTEGVVESMLVGAALGGLGGGYEGFRHRQHAVQAVWDRVHEAKKAADFEYYQNASLSMAASNEAKARAAVYAQMQGWQDVPPDQWPAPVHPTVQPTQAPAGLSQDQKDLYDALAMPPWARNAQQKLIADNYEKDFRNALSQASKLEVPEPGFDYIPQVAPVPAAFGGPRPPWLANTRAEEARTLPSPIAPTGYEPGEIARTGAAPSLPEEIVHLTNLVDQTGDPTAAKRLTDLIMANKDSVGALFEPRGREDLRPIAEHLNNLFTKVDEGDPNAARELHEFLSANIDLLRGATRLEIAVATPPAPIVEVNGTGPDATITSPPGAGPAPPEGATPPGAPPPGTPPPTTPTPPPSLGTPPGPGVAPPAAGAPPLALGNEGKATTARGTEVGFQYAIVDGKNLITSHDDSMDENPNFPAELQPRDRTKAASAAQVAEYAGNLKPELLGENPLAAHGAPMVGSDMVVESGNARTLAVMRAYANKNAQAEKYRAWLEKEAPRFGLDPTAAKSAEAPMLVKVRTTEVSPEQRVALTRELNERETAPMSAVEQAKNDARAMLDSNILSLFVPSEDGEIGKTANLDFLRAFMNRIVGSTGLAEYVDSNGRINQAGLARVRNAIFAAAYGDTAALERLAESTSDASRNITAALTMAAPRMAMQKRMMDMGHLYPLDLNANLGEAATIYQSLRENGISVEDYLAQGQLLNQVDPLTMELVKIFGDFGRSAKKLAAILNNYMDIVENLGDPKQGALIDLGIEIPDKATALQAAIVNMEGPDVSTKLPPTGPKTGPKTGGGGKGPEAPKGPQGPGVEGERKAIPENLGVTKKGNAVGFTAKGETITVGYMAGRKAWVVATWTQAGSPTPNIQTSTENFPTEKEAREHAASLMDYAQTKKRAWWDIEDLFSGPKALPAIQVLAKMAPGSWQEFIGLNDAEFADIEKAVKAKMVLVRQDPKTKKVQYGPAEGLAKWLADQEGKAPPKAPEPKAKPKEFKTVDLADKFQPLIEEARNLREMGTQRQIKTADLIKLVKENYDIEDVEPHKKKIEEAFELAIVRDARKLEGSYKDEEKGLKAMEALYAIQPALASRTSTTIRHQAYSTPAPLAYLMSKWAKVDKSSFVYEPTAGNGMLLMGANPKQTLANELDPIRAEHLKKQGFIVTEKDGSALVGKKGGPKENSVDVVLANPPFGKLDEPITEDGYRITKKEHAIAIDALKAMDDDGRAAIIIGGHSFATPYGQEMKTLTETDRIFFNYLYSHYNVTHNINVDGAVYERMGTKFPIRLITIEGRKATQEGVAPWDSKQIESAKTFKDVYNILKGEPHAEPMASGLPPTELGGPNGPGGPTPGGGKGPVSGPIPGPMGGKGGAPPAGAGGGATGGRPSGPTSPGPGPGPRGPVGGQPPNVSGQPPQQPGGAGKTPSIPPKTGPGIQTKPPGPVSPGGPGPVTPGGGGGTAGPKPGGVPPKSLAPGSYTLPNGTVVTIEKEKAAPSPKRRLSFFTGTPPAAPQLSERAMELTAKTPLNEYLKNDKREQRRTAAFNDVESAIRDLGRDNLEPIGLTADKSIETWLKEIQEKQPTWHKGGRRTGQTAIEWLSKPWEIYKDRAGEDALRKSLLTYVRGERAGWFEKNENFDSPGILTPVKHRQAVERALNEGKEVYEGWQKDYPDLAAEKQPATKDPLIKVTDQNGNVLEVPVSLLIQKNQWVETANGTTGQITKIRGFFEEMQITVKAEDGTTSVLTPAQIANILPGKPEEKPVEQAAPPPESNLQVFYQPVSKGNSMRTMAPRYMAEATHQFLEKLQTRVGDIDEYVRQKLNYPKMEDLYKALGAEQIEGVAMAIDAIEGSSAAPTTGPLSWQENPANHTWDATGIGGAYRIAEKGDGKFEVLHKNIEGKMLPTKGLEPFDSLKQAQAYVKRSEELAQKLFGQQVLWTETWDVTRNERTWATEGLSPNYTILKVGDKYQVRTPGATVGLHPSLEDAKAAVERMVQESGQTPAGSGGSFIIGHQTGVGKGRMVAALIEYAKSRGWTPVFLTADAKLFSDMYRDFRGINREINPLLIASDANRAKIYDDQGNVIRKLEEEKLKKAVRAREVPAENDAVFSTYYQFMKQEMTPKKEFLRSIPNAFFILDESHLASGDSNIGRFLTDIVLPNSKGVIFSSATFAKRPDTMLLYLSRMAADLNIDTETLIDNIKRGGVPLQEWIAHQWGTSGQMVRNELSFIKENDFNILDAKGQVVMNFKGENAQAQAEAYAKENGGEVEPAKIEMPLEMDTANKERDRVKSDELTFCLRGVLDFSNKLVEYVKNVLKPQFIKDGVNIHGKSFQGTLKITGFSSVMHNAIAQMQYCLRVDTTIKEALAALERGEKPVIGVYNTMESFMNFMVDNSQAVVGQPVDMNFSHVLRKALEGTLYYWEVDHQGKKTKKRLDVSMLPQHLQDAFNKVANDVDTLVTDVPALPIDAIMKALRDYRSPKFPNGVKIGEITGRKFKLDYNEAGEGILAQRKEKEINDKNTPVIEFNNGKLDAILVNSAASTGISLHASKEFKDQRARRMLLAQLAYNIDTVVQLLGRIHRTGQVTDPLYKILISTLPSEKRPLSLFQKKLASLMANVTAKGEASYSLNIPDVINHIGDQAVAEIFAETPEMSQRLGGVLHEIVSKPKFMNAGIETRVEIILAQFPSEGDLIKKVSGYVAVQQVDAQEEFWANLDAKYNERVEYLKQMGEYNLETEDLDLQARTIEKSLLNQGTEGGRNELSGSTYFETVFSKVQRKPYKAKDIEDRIKRALNISEDSLIGEQTIRDLSRQKASDLETQIRADFQTWIGEKAGLMARANSPEVIEGFKTRATRAMNSTLTQIQRLRVGLHVGIATAGDVLEGVIYDVRYKATEGSNPGTPSNVKLLIAVNSTMRTFQTSLAGAGSITSFDSTIRYGIPQGWDESLPQENFETRHLVTGNLLGNTIDAGRIIHFTREDGSVDMGFLMPANFNPGTQQQLERVVVNQAQALRLLQNPEQSLLGVGNNVIMSQVRPGEWTLSVPQSRKDGGKFYLDDDILAHVQNGEFYQAHNRMEGLIKGPQSLNTVLETLYRNHQVAFTTDRGTFEKHFGPIQQAGPGAQNRRNLEKAGIPVTRAVEQTLTQATPQEEKLTLDFVKSRLKDAEVTEVKGGYNVVLPSGKLLAILTDQNIAKGSFEELQQTYPGLTRSEFEAGMVLGEWRPMSVGGVIALAKGAGQITLDHELLHAAADLVLTKAENEAILKKYGDWEAAAKAYQAWQPAQQKHTLFQKIFDFFSRLAEVLNPRRTELNPQGVFANLRDGSVWTRTAAETPTVGKAMKSFVQEAEQRNQEYRDQVLALPAKKSTWQRIKETFSVSNIKEQGETLRTWYDEIVDRYASFERHQMKVLGLGANIPKGELLTYNLAFMRGQEGWVAQATYKNGIYHETMIGGNEFEGDAMKVGPSLYDRLAPLRELAKRRGWKEDKVIHDDLFNTFMVAQRDLELSGEEEGMGIRKKGEIKGTKPDLSRQALADLKTIYGEADYQILEKAAGIYSEGGIRGTFTPGSVREWADQAILQRLLQAGVIDMARYEQIKAKNQFYVPFKRLMDDLEGYISSYNQALGGQPLKQIKGSEKEILDPMQMLMNLAATANYVYARNRVLSSTAKLAQYGDTDIKEVRAKYIPIKEMMAQEMDVGLRNQLWALARKLNVNIKMVKSLGGRTLGHFAREIRQEVRDGQLTNVEYKEIVSRFATSERHLAHELGHALDYALGLEKALIDQGSKEMKDELRSIADQRASFSSSPSYKNEVRKKKEQVAEFVARYIADRAEAKQMAPTAVRVLESILRAKGMQEIISFKWSHAKSLLDWENTVWARSPLPPEPGTVPYYRDGSQRWLKLPPDMYRATQMMMPEDMGLFMRIAKAPADLLRAGAVTTPEFGLFTNPVRDIVQAWVMSRFGFNPLLWFRDLGKLVSKDPATLEARAKAEAMGGFLATLSQSFIEPEHITADYISGAEKGLIYKAHPIEALRYVSAYLENMTRFSIYQQAIEKGLSPAEAIHEMRRTTLDFRRTGGHPVVRYLNMIIPFFNAGIQGTDKLLSEMTGPNKWAVMRRLSMLTLGSLGLWMLCHSDDRYKELENWERNYFWHIPLPGKDSPMLRIPKPFEAGVLFGSVPERMMDQLFDKNVGGIQSALGAAWKALTPDFIPALVRPVVEGYSNYNWFLDRPIEDASLQNLPVELRTKPWTTELSKATARLVQPVVGPVMDISPVKMEHFIRTSTGSLGANYFLPGIDVLLRKAGVLNDIPQPTQDIIQRAWGVRAFFSKPTTGFRAKTVNDVMENYQNILRSDQGWKLLWNTGQAQQLTTFLDEHPEAMFARVARQTMTDLGKIRKEREKVYLDKTMDSDTKRAKLDALDEKTVQVAKIAQAFMDPEVAKALKMPPRTRIVNGMKVSLDLDGYYKYTVESVGDAYTELKPQLAKIAAMDEDQRVAFLTKKLKEARDDYQPTLKKPEDVMKPYRFSNLFDKPTRKEKATWQSTMGFGRIPSGAASGYRMKEEGGQ